MKISPLQAILLCTSFLIITGESIARKGKTHAGKAGATDTTIYHKITQFIEMEKKHKDDWFNHIAQFHHDKIHLLKKHHDECANLHAEKMKQMERNGCSPDLFEEYLKKAIEQHKRHKIQWHDLHEKNHTQCNTIADKHDKELRHFENTLP